MRKNLIYSQITVLVSIGIETRYRQLSVPRGILVPKSTCKLTLEINICSHTTKRGQIEVAFDEFLWDSASTKNHQQSSAAFMYAGDCVCRKSRILTEKIKQKLPELTFYCNISFIDSDCEMTWQVMTMMNCLKCYGLVWANFQLQSLYKVFKHWAFILWSFTS